MKVGLHVVLCVNLLGCQLLCFFLYISWTNKYLIRRRRHDHTWGLFQASIKGFSVLLPSWLDLCLLQSLELNTTSWHWGIDLGLLSKVCCLEYGFFVVFHVPSSRMLGQFH